MRKKIITAKFSIDIGAAANSAITIAKKLNANPEYKKCVGIGLALSSEGGVSWSASVENIPGRPLIDPVHFSLLKVDSGVKPDDRLLSVEFDITADDVNLIITPDVITTTKITGQIIYLLSN